MVHKRNARQRQVSETTRRRINWVSSRILLPLFILFAVAVQVLGHMSVAHASAGDSRCTGDPRSAHIYCAGTSVDELYCGIARTGRADGGYPAAYAAFESNGCSGDGSPAASLSGSNVTATLQGWLRPWFLLMVSLGALGFIFRRQLLPLLTEYTGIAIGAAILFFVPGIVGIIAVALTS